MIEPPMRQTLERTAVAVVGGALLAMTAVLDADTLVLRSGRRLEGALVTVAGDRIVFRENRGHEQEFDRGEVRAIELESGFGRPQAPRSSNRPRGLREREVIVSGDLPFVDTGIDVRVGQALYFEAIGNVWWRRNRKDGPAGNSAESYNPKLPMPRRPLAALIGKVGEESADLIFVGDDPGPIRVRTAGRLMLGVNDDYFGDNHGNFRVVVFY
jgi:hypothetical protein